MRTITYIFIIQLALILSLSAQTNEFSYQGFVTDNNAPANGSYDLEFRVFSALTGGAPLATETRPAVAVVNGVFSVTLDFGVFPNTDRYIEIGVRPSGGGAFTTLSPRSKVMAAPHSTFAKNALQLGGVNANQFVLGNDPRLSDARNPLPNSGNYIQNRTTLQSGASFNISGDGTLNGTLKANIVEVGTQLDNQNGRILAKVGQNNLFLGTLAGSANGGIQNTFLGDSAGRLNTGNENAMGGFIAGQNSTTGNNNTFFGSRAGVANTTGSSNTLIGYKADAGSNNLTNATAIGANAFVEQNNTLVLGGIQGVNGATSMTDVGIGVTNPARRLDVNGNIRVGGTTTTTGCVEDRDGTVIAGNCASDLRFKKDIKPFGNVLSNFAKLRPVNYFWRADEFAELRFGTRQSFGLIAQDVEKLFPELVSTDEKGFKAVNYSKLPLYTIQAVGELKSENDRLRAQLDRQQQQIEELRTMVRTRNHARRGSRARKEAK